MSDQLPYWRLGAVYFAYFSVVGAMSPFWGVYLEHLGYEAKTIGFICAVPMITRILAPNIWGWIADKTGKLLTVIILGSLGAWLGFLGVLFKQTFWWIVGFIFLFSFFWNAIIAQFEVITLRFLKDEPNRYGQIRLWGSIGFIVTVTALGFVLDYFPITILPWCVFAFLGCIVVACISLPRPPKAVVHQTSESFYKTLKKPHVITFMAVVFIMQCSLGMYHAFYSLYLEKFGYSRSMIGILWSIGALAEVALFIYLPKLLHRFSLFALLNSVLIITLVRWVVIDSVPESLIFLIIAQLGHAFTFGLCHGLAVSFIRTHFSDGAQSQGQAFYSAFGFGGASAVGSILAGYIFDYDYALLFTVAAVLTLIALIVQLGARIGARKSA